jgi:hypothetical protein
MVHSKNKGSSFERTVRDLLVDRGYSANRGQQFKGTPDSPDVECKGLGWIHIECKAVEAVNPYKFYEQACEDASKEQVPLVVFKRNRKPIMALMSAEDLLDLIECLDKGLDKVDNGISRRINGFRRRFRESDSGEESGGDIPGQIEGDRRGDVSGSDCL